MSRRRSQPTPWCRREALRLRPRVCRLELTRRPHSGFPGPSTEGPVDPVRSGALGRRWRDAVSPGGEREFLVRAGSVAPAVPFQGVSLLPSKRDVKKKGQTHISPFLAEHPCRSPGSFPGVSAAVLHMGRLRLRW